LCAVVFALELLHYRASSWWGHAVLERFVHCSQRKKNNKKDQALERLLEIKQSNNKCKTFTQTESLRNGFKRA